MNSKLKYIKSEFLIFKIKSSQNYHSAENILLFLISNYVNLACDSSKLPLDRKKVIFLREIKQSSLSSATLTDYREVTGTEVTSNGG